MTGYFRDANDALEAVHNVARKQAADRGCPRDESIFTVDQLIALATTRAPIAQATELRNLNAILHDATDLNGAVKVALPHPVEQALIAIAERRPQFVQVGQHQIRADAIAWIYDGSESLVVCSNTGAVMADLTGPAKAAFLLWHEQHADVVQLPQAPDPTAATAYNDDLS